MICKATKTDNLSIEKSVWDGKQWKDIRAQLIRHHMGSEPVHFPKAEVKIAYDTTAVFIMFRVEDRYVRAVAAADQDDVYKDSCVEFFFCPGPDLSKGYFNLEMNCGGRLLFHFQPRPGEDRIVIPVDECLKIKRMHSLPGIVDPEIQEPVIWSVAYEIPIALLEKYCRVIPPSPEAAWRVNFYKCGDSTSHPHWLTWAPVDYPKPNFHIPRYFGTLKFQ